ncbi:hypothetical protein C2E25_04725 [Geothermobacter hydrogeniphilus]|uniref:Leucine rich repeat variant n=1 Tax=Geothermobacter hydrogeniphilus TaxID=1969733 RepID=A0A2K2HC68_9BACT|nr:hypothetical protein [Geothermobacter hydrogeniphilus]PNU20898.1 hypothetical protein C2E25_04725 [Geothermobacter hydrogeniphilus]
MGDERDKAIRLLCALRADGDELFQLVRDSDPEVLLNLLKNPGVGEEHLLVLLKRRDLPEGLLKAIDQRTREKAGHRLQLALARNPNTPAATVLRLLPHLYLFELLDLCTLPGPTPDQRLAAERQIILRLPGEELGNKLSLARRATSTILQALIRDGDPRLVQACLDNPRLKEVALLQFLRSGKANAESISQIARHPRWQQRRQLRLAILKCPKTPAVWYTLWLPRLKSGDLRALAAQRNLPVRQKELLKAEMKKRGLG